ncbi:hypothetical protein NC796_12450 [Aliifodinibius sp. S!AR15-10]|uniref:hypothetical protein n=1 Tax=Aliifodinibius sp. S!AR15-10 TaxID=2950437 RepID=UPI002856B800|nr:hypothetical protein [Aliifodinibius sp. S!AR15-10]MDR8391960.1 hypothetical protein [Aliifodinibius sp. S!AR15-10]
MKERLFQSLREQLAYEIMFVKNVSRVYRDAPKKVQIVDFEYRGMACRLVLNGVIMLETDKGETHIKSYHDLVQGLIQSNYAKKKVA